MMRILRFLHGLPWWLARVGRGEGTVCLSSAFKLAWILSWRAPR